MAVKKTYRSIDERTAVELMARFRPLVRGIIRALYVRVPDQDVLVSAGDEAILEAYLSHDPERAKLETWVRRRVHWALSAAAKQPTIADVAFDPVNPRLLNGADPEEQFWRATAIHAIGKLDQREATITIARMQDETYEEIAETLGVSTSRAGRVGKRALDKLREILQAT